jgi:hypothetical protein
MVNFEYSLVLQLEACLLCDHHYQFDTIPSGIEYPHEVSDGGSL